MGIAKALDYSDCYATDAHPEKSEKGFVYRHEAG
jgi:hypothetical protein